MSVVAKACLLYVRRSCGCFGGGAMLGALALLLAVGCGKSDHGDRQPISGTVTVQGQPLDVKATIYFDPVKGAIGVGSAGEVSESKFTIPVESGPTPGLKYKVTLITAPGIPADGTPLKDIKQPEQFEKEVEIPGGGEEAIVLSIDFDAKKK